MEIQKNNIEEKKPNPATTFLVAAILFTVIVFMFFTSLIAIKGDNVERFIEQAIPWCIAGLGCGVLGYILIRFGINTEAGRQVSDENNSDKEAAIKELMLKAEKRLSEIDPDANGYVYCIAGFPSVNPTVYDVKQIHISNLTLGNLANARFFASEVDARKAMYSIEGR